MLESMFKHHVSRQLHRLILILKQAARQRDQSLDALALGGRSRLTDVQLDAGREINAPPALLILRQLLLGCGGSATLRHELAQQTGLLWWCRRSFLHSLGCG